MRTGLRVVTALLSLFFFVDASGQAVISPPESVALKFLALYPGATHEEWLSDVYKGDYVNKAEFYYKDKELVVLFNARGDTIGQPTVLEIHMMHNESSVWHVAKEVKQKLAKLYPDTLHVSWNGSVMYSDASLFLLRQGLDTLKDYNRISVDFYDTAVESISIPYPDSSLVPLCIQAYMKKNFPKYIIYREKRDYNPVYKEMEYVMYIHKSDGKDVRTGYGYYGKHYVLEFSSKGELWDKQHYRKEKSRVTVCRFCFTAGTQITMSDGSAKPIAQIKTGDGIMNYNSAAMRFEMDTVRAIVSPEHDNLIMIKFSDATTVTSTADHPYMVKNRGYTALRVGDTCEKLDNGKLKDVEVVSIQAQKGKVRTYNIFTLHNHNYFANGVLVSDEDPENP